MKQYADDASTIFEIYIEDVTKPELKWNESPLDQNKILFSLGLLKELKAYDPREALVLHSAKKYYKNAGNLPNEGVKLEMESARKNPTTHYPDIIEAAKYFVLGIILDIYPIWYNLIKGFDKFIDPKDKMAVKHELLELCFHNALTKVN